MGGVDVVVISAAVSNVGGALEFAKEREVIRTNVVGFAALVDYSYRYFCERGGGHIVAISSVSGIRGRPCMPAYSASKAFVSNYVEALRCRAKKQKTNVLFTDIRPGYVDTEMLGLMSEGKAFWVCSAENAAKEIARAIMRRKKVAYITRRWGLVAFIMRFIPDWVNMHF
jgi:short-subunit dehydrogenase